MATAPERKRDDDAAEARRWVAEVDRKAKRGELTGDGAFLRRKLAEEKRKLRQK